MSREDYDAVPYPTSPHVDSHPSTMQTMAAAFGLHPPAIESARVLEIGCATGGNIVPIACALPNAEFVGIDYSARQIEAASKFASAVNATNLKLETKSILDITPEFGQFDYIFAHGIFSWVPDDVREKLLSICRENLSDNGVAFVSFNCYPGWHAMQWLRELVLTAVPIDAHQSPAARLSAAKIAIDAVLNSREMKAGSFGAAMKKIADDYKRNGDVQWLHDLLEESNHPFYFKDFVARAGVHGLTYLADGLTNGSFAEEQNPPLKSLLDTAGKDWVRREQLLDFFRNNTFRRALLVKREASFERVINRERFQDFFVTTALKPEATGPALEDSRVVKLQDPAGRGMASGLPLTKMALTILGARFPQATRLSDLLSEAAAALRWSDERLQVERARTVEELIIAWMGAILHATVTPAALNLTPGERPEIWRVSRYQVSIGQAALTNLRHEVVNVDLKDHALVTMLQLLDGTRTREQVVDEFAARTPSFNPSLRPKALATLEQILQGAARLAVLVR